MPDGPAAAAKTEMKSLRNVGPAALADLAVLGIRTVAQLALQEADDLYARLCLATQARHDACVHDVLAAAIHQARTGQPLNWWAFSAGRKARRAAGTFPLPSLPPV